MKKKSIKTKSLSSKTSPDNLFVLDILYLYMATMRANLSAFIKKRM